MAQPYFVIEKIKGNLNISQENQDLDETLKIFGKEADNWVDMNLRSVATVPLATVPEEIKTIASMYAAGRWQMVNQGDPSKRSAYIIQAERDIEIYKENLVGATEQTSKAIFFHI